MRSRAEVSLLPAARLTQTKTPRRCYDERMPSHRSIFDVIGPVMIGPSSSHTAGAVRLGALARAILGEQPATALIQLHGSFASTGRGHGTDLALAAGLMGMSPDDDRIPKALAHAGTQGLDVTFSEADLGETHPNTARFLLTTAGGREMVVQGSSIGGGDVLITLIDDFVVEANGELPLLIVEHVDQPGAIASVTSALADSGTNIAEMRVSRERRGARALMLIETDVTVTDDVVARVAAQPGITGVRRVAAV